MSNENIDTDYLQHIKEHPGCIPLSNLRPVVDRLVKEGLVVRKAYGKHYLLYATEGETDDR